MLACGYSIGGNTLAKYLGKYSEEKLISAAFCCHTPMKFWETMKNLKTNLFGIGDFFSGIKFYKLNHKYANFIQDTYFHKVSKVPIH